MSFFRRPRSHIAVLTPPQEQLLALVATISDEYATNGLVVSRKDGRLYFDGDPKKGEDVSLIRDLFGTVDTLKQREFVELIESLHLSFYALFLRCDGTAHLWVAITELGSRYLRDRKPQPHTDDPSTLVSNYDSGLLGSLGPGMTRLQKALRIDVNVELD